jgi:hypothetical protein
MIMPYIDSEALKKKIFSYGMPDNGNYGINAKSVMVAIENAPAVDAVEVVRCKDCVNYEERFGGCGYCWHWDYEQGELPNRVDEDDFCCYGERKTDD